MREQLILDPSFLEHSQNGGPGGLFNYSWLFSTDLCGGVLNRTAKPLYQTLLNEPEPFVLGSLMIGGAP
jgi:hypothetical protein